MGKKRFHPDEEELSLFRSEMGETAPLDHDKADPYHQRRAPYPIPQPKEDEEEEEIGYLRPMETGEELQFVRPGIQKRLFQDLRRGQLVPEDVLDLHGLRVVEARQALSGFLQHARRHRLRVVQIIHGKGRGSSSQQPVLKQFVNQWLPQRPEVLAYCSAPSFDGGTGAAYVLLSRKEKQDR
ncbi:MAG: DNA mismatch repair protein MutS [Gammaproteobacteria bacterium]|nr:DNA mismatch repair protein MutS [Gammaproteobacteria bacterium]